MAERKRYFRKIIHISAEDIPNVRIGILEQRLGEPISPPVIPGVLTYEEYVQRRTTWDKVRQHVGLSGRFWEGGETLLYPPTWIDRAERLALYLKNKTRIARGVGVDPGEGSANTSICVVDEFGIIKLYSEKTPNTDRVIDMVIDIILRYGVPPERVLIDRGGGGKQHADQLRKAGYQVRTIGFGDKPSIEPQRHRTMFQQKVEDRENKSTYLNRRAEMYYKLRILLDPGSDDREYSSESAWTEVSAERQRIVGEIRGFTIPHEYHKLREQMSPIPLLTDSEHRIRIPPKHKKDAKSKETTLVDIIGYSPDELDATVLAIHAMQMSNVRTTAGAI